MSEVADCVGWRLAEWEHSGDKADLWRLGVSILLVGCIFQGKEHIQWIALVLERYQERQQLESDMMMTPGTMNLH
jgi:hypothetical protein